MLTKIKKFIYRLFGLGRCKTCKWSATTYGEWYCHYHYGYVQDNVLPISDPEYCFCDDWEENK